ncbi:DUF3093 domain-containing protein [Mycobacterium uberis]|uniref:DUF3093 domain-containing protein n=1 Tax=Mycobacterium uberis TaxID=2162698 RepID=UPI001A9DB7E4|nr:DUF3093 domain-containing protein [Mycobacterium uberis]
MTSTTETNRKPLFYEPGASWIWLLSGPVAATFMILIEIWSGASVQPVIPLIFLVLVSGFVGIQVKAARIHYSVELTDDALRQGTETILVAEIVKIYPEAENAPASDKELQPWQSARALGELAGVPRGRIGIGLKLNGGRTAQAWARHHRPFRATLTSLVHERVEPARVDSADVGDDDNNGSPR